jgi:hypothetical protein
VAAYYEKGEDRVDWGELEYSISWVEE